MGVSFALFYHQDVVQKDIPKLSEQDRKRIKKAIEGKLSTAPEQFGKPLRRSLKGYRKLRVGDYRIIFHIEKKNVMILAIQHRSVVYKQSEQQLG